MTHAHMPDAATLDRLRNDSPNGPVVLLNLLKYREPNGRDAFARYGAVTGPLIGKAGGQLIFGGKAGPALSGTDVAWDDVLLLRFPSVDRFLGMIESETYQNEAAPIREEALADTVWLAIHPMQGFEQ